LKSNSRIYNVKFLTTYTAGWWKDAPKAKIDIFPWASQMADDYRPLTSACLGTDGNSVFVYMESDETDLRMETKGFGYVHTDSCMEFFFSPDPASPKYLNFEFNPAGAMQLSIGTSRYDREILPVENFTDFFRVRTTVYESGWDLEYSVPLSFITRFFPSIKKLASGNKMRGNFYKCGDNTKRPHYGCWSPIDLAKPDFHCPQFFGVLNF
jgi:hypothetical protein